MSWVPLPTSKLRSSCGCIANSPDANFKPNLHALVHRHEIYHNYVRVYQEILNFRKRFKNILRMNICIINSFISKSNLKDS